MIVSAPLCAFASRIACRSEPAPESFVFVTTSPPCGPAKHGENSDVLPSGSVAVSVYFAGPASGVLNTTPPSPAAFVVSDIDSAGTVGSSPSP